MPLNRCRAFEEGLQKFVENAKPGILSAIREKKALDDGLKAEMTAAIKEFKDAFMKGQK